MMNTLARSWTLQYLWTLFLTLVTTVKNYEKWTIVLESRALKLSCWWTELFSLGEWIPVALSPVLFNVVQCHFADWYRFPPPPESFYVGTGSIVLTRVRNKNRRHVNELETREKTRLLPPGERTNPTAGSTNPTSFITNEKQSRKRRQKKSEHRSLHSNAFCYSRLGWIRFRQTRIEFTEAAMRGGVLPPWRRSFVWGVVRVQLLRVNEVFTSDGLSPPPALIFVRSWGMGNVFNGWRWPLWGRFFHAMCWDNCGGTI